MNERLKIALSIALGAFLGTFVARGVNPNFWWLGLLVGGFTAYLSYEYQKVFHAVPIAWKKTVNGMPDKKWWKARLESYIWGTLISFTFCSYIALLYFLMPQSQKISIAEAKEIAIPFIGITTLGLGLLMAVLGVPPVSTYGLSPKTIVLKCNPISVGCYYLPKLIITMVIELAKIAIKTPSAVKTTARFLKTLFIMIHSQERLLCAAYAAAGTAVNYFYNGHILVGMIVGIICGLIDYEIISIRILHLQPKKEKK